MGAFRSCALSACCLLAGWPSACPAAVVAGGALALTRDDIYRGVSETCGHPAAQADLHLRAQGVSAWAAFLGVWGSAGLGGGCGSTKEVDAYAGISLTLTPSLSATLTYTRYTFPGGGYDNAYVLEHRYDYDQLGASWSVRNRLYLTLAWTPDALRYERYEGSLRTRQNRSAFAYGAQWRQPLIRGLSLALGAGYDHMADPFGTGYGFWSLGLTQVSGPVELDLGYFRTAGRAVRLFGPQAAGGRVSVTALWRF